MSNPIPRRRAWTTREAAAMLGLSYGALMRAVREGEIPAVKIGKGYLIPDVAIQKLLGEEVTETDSDAGPLPGA